jgi:hypothetical protein
MVVISKKQLKGGKGYPYFPEGVPVFGGMLKNRWVK